MVRLLVPPGAGLHPAIRMEEEPLCANPVTPSVLFSPMIASILLLGRIIVKRPLLSLPTRPAYFVTRAGLATVACTSAATYLTHHNRQIDASILHYEGITPPKYQLWQSSQGFTNDDAVLIGGIGGLLLSFRMRSLGSVSIGHRLLGRLGAISTGVAAQELVQNIPFLGLEVDLESPSRQRSRYEQAVALRKLNDDPKFNESLALGSQLAERNWKRTVQAERKAMSFDSLTEEEKAVLRPTMVFSWLDVASNEDLEKRLSNGLPVAWQYPEDASPAEKRNYILREVEFVAAMFRPYAHDRSRALQLKPISRQPDGTAAAEHAVLTQVLVDLMRGLLATEDGKNQKRIMLHDWLSIIDADRGEAHVPVESVEHLRQLRKEFSESNHPNFIAAIDALLQNFEGHALRKQ